ncbi:hypothetical protein [Piscinibacterium candidicorallinum]|uniref:Uncharacterized protein n=1 Tax=Piscinibacterium candidicorallinum TaxID=1793872 RepID=A0ABV7GZK4_9BURK
MRRRLDTHEQCLKAFTAELKTEIRSSLSAWDTLDRKEASGRRMAYMQVVTLIKRHAEAHGIPLADLGLVDYEVPASPL